KVIFNNSDSLPTCCTDAVAMAMDCGEINFAATPPTVFEDTSNAPLVPILLATAACIGANNVLLFVTEPVKKTPIHPKTGDSNGNHDPVFAITSPKALLKPAYVINFEITKIIHIVIIGNHNSLNVTLNKRVASNKLTCLDINIVMITTNKMAVPVCPIIFSGSVVALSAISL